jgi:hypothetical protein
MSVPKPARSRRRDPSPGAPTAATPSALARQRAAVILEVLAGVRLPAQAAQALAVSLPRYYMLETKALQGLLTACEPAPRGPAADQGRAQQALRAECARWQRECARQQALLRAAQRALGLTPPTTPPPVKDGQKRRQPRRPRVRALQAAARLRAAAAAEQTVSTATPPPS